MIFSSDKPSRKLSAALTACLLTVVALVAGIPNAQGQVVDPINNSEQLMSLNFRDAPVDQVLTTYSKLTGRTLLQMPNLKAKVTLVSNEKLTIRESLQAIESKLLMHNISLVPMGTKFIKVVQSQQASQAGMIINTGQPESALQEADQLVTQVIQLEHVEVSEVQGILQGLLHGFGKIQPLERSNCMLITATSINIKRIFDLLRILDQPIELNIETRVYELNYASAEEVASKLQELIEQVQADKKSKSSTRTAKISGVPSVRTPPGVIRARSSARPNSQMNAMVAAAGEMADRSMIRGDVKIVADDRTNIIFIFSRAENFAFFDRLIKVLDRQVSPEIITKVVALEYADAEEISTILNEFVGAASSDKNETRSGAATANTNSGKRSQALRDYVKKKASTRPRTSSTQETALGRLSPDTKILADKRTNSLLIMGRQGDVAALTNVIKHLDIILAQVLIEAVIVEVSLNKGIDYGVDWLQRSLTVYNQENTGPNGGIAVNQPVFSFAGGQKMGESANFQDASSLVDRAIPLASGGLSYYLTFFDLNIDAVIKMTASSDDARILSTPVILTTDNTEAKIIVGEQRPVVTSSSTTVGGEQRSAYEYKDIGIHLTVKPRVNPARYVVMEVAQSVDNVGGFEMIDGNRVPIITKRELEAQIAVKSGQTIVLGGLVNTDKRKSRTRVPILSNIPVLGALFRSDSKSDDRRELLVLITPYVMLSPEETMEQTERLHNASYSSETEWHQDWSGSPLSHKKKRKGLFARIFGKKDKEIRQPKPSKPGFEGDKIIKTGKTDNLSTPVETPSNLPPADNTVVEKPPLKTKPKPGFEGDSIIKKNEDGDAPAKKETALSKPDNSAVYREDITPRIDNKYLKETLPR